MKSAPQVPDRWRSSQIQFLLTEDKPREQVRQPKVQDSSDKQPQDPAASEHHIREKAICEPGDIESIQMEIIYKNLSWRK